MNRRVAAWAAAMATLSFTAMILWLNLREEDFYPHALDAPPTDLLNAPRPAWLPEGATLTENRITLRVEDRDGWYRLFWAGTDVYYYDDPSYFGAALANSTVAGFDGRWTIKGACKAGSFEVTYTLREGPPIDGVSEIGPLKVPSGFRWFTRDYVTGPRTFSWILERR